MYGTFITFHVATRDTPQGHFQGHLYINNSTVQVWDCVQLF